jgi:hypothetical protein
MLLAYLCRASWTRPILTRLRRCSGCHCACGSCVERRILTVPPHPTHVDRLTQTSIALATKQPRDELEANPEFSGLDFGALTPGWTSKAGFYAAEDRAFRARAAWVRRWLRDQPEGKIVVVAHSGILRYITEGYNSRKFWATVEVGEYTFASDEEDEEANIVPVPVPV